MTDDEKMRQELHDLKQEVAALRGDMKDLLDAWRTATGLLKFVKWLATFGAAIGGAWIVWKQL